MKWTAIAVSVSYGPVLLALPWIAIGALWWVGRAHANANMTGWMSPPRNDDDAGLVVTADTIVLALQNLDKIPALKRAFKDGWRPTFHTLPVRDGRGYSAVFSAPLGVTAGMIADQRPVLARNVHRAEVEVWPSDAEQAGTGPAGTVAVWIADPGVLAKAAPEYPLMHEGTADVFEGVPAGISPRGDEVTVPIVGNNMVAWWLDGPRKVQRLPGGDARVRARPAGRAGRVRVREQRRLRQLRPAPGQVSQGRRRRRDRGCGAAAACSCTPRSAVVRAVSPTWARRRSRGSLAKAHRDLRPVVTLFSEGHELFGHDEFGAVAAELATKTIKRARKTGVTLLFDTQSSRKEAIPPKLVELCRVNACFYVKTWRSNDGFLGDGASPPGIRSTELRPGRDRGTSVITGVSDAQFELLRWYFVEVDDDTGYDAAADVIARAVAKVAAGTTVEGSAPVAAIESRDLLADLGQVAGDDRVKLRDAVGLLRKLAPAWSRYQRMTAKQLRRRPQGRGRPHDQLVRHALVFHPADVRRVLAERDDR